jgi:hypothetical protein
MAATKGQVENRRCINDIKPLLCSKDMNKSLEKQDFCYLLLMKKLQIGSECMGSIQQAKRPARSHMRMQGFFFDESSF